MKQRKLRNDIFLSIVAALAVAVLAWVVGFASPKAHAGVSLTQVSDTMSNTVPGLGSIHTIQYTNPSSTPATSTIVFTFDATTNLFTNATAIATSDIAVTGTSLATSSCPGSGNNIQYTGNTANTLTFTVCPSNTVPAGTLKFTIGTSSAPSHWIVNPTTTNSYVIRIGGTQPSGADTRIAIVNSVNVTAAINTTFTFTVAGLPNGTTSQNNATTTGISTTTTLPFGTLTPGTHAELGQQLYVTTNAANGFAVTVREDAPLQSSKGNVINQFPNGVPSSTPSAWSSPSNTLDAPATYSHIGVTSDDTDLSTSDGYTSQNYGTVSPLYAGAFNATATPPLVVFAHTGPSDGLTQNKGTAKVFYRIEIGSLQAAANDYTDNLIYVATPTF